MGFPLPPPPPPPKFGSINNGLPYSRKYWQSLNLVVLPQTTFFTLLADLNLAVWYGIAIRTCTQKKKLANFNSAVERHTANKPNFPAIRYMA